MNRRAAWISLGVAAIVVVSILVDPTQVVLGKLFGEAFFQARPTRFWTRSLRAEAVDRLTNGGSDAVPVLVEMLRGSTAARDAAEILGKMGPDAADAGPAMVAGVRDADPHVQAVCAAALAKVGVPAAEAVPLLT